jgi:FAD-dependent oxidoreductase domain-containing protein 1
VSPPPDADPDYSASLSAAELLPSLALTAADHADMWESIVWPAIARLVPRLEDARVVSGWAGFYDYCTHDQNALFGVHPAGARNVVYATGFSGHGIQQAAGAGRAVAELLTHGRYVSIDLERFAVGRYLKGVRVVETAIV